MSTDWYETAYDLGIAEGMTPEEAHEWAERTARKAAMRTLDPVDTPGVSGVMESSDSNTPLTPHMGIRERFGLRAVMENAEKRPEPKMVVDGLLPQGLTLLAGGSKLGKSYMSLDIAFAVASGTLALGHLVTEPGDVLYLALEDRDDRIRRRMMELEPDHSSWPWDRLMLATINGIKDYPPGRLAVEWAQSVENPTLVIIDTITRFGGQGDREGYKADVAWMTKFHSYAQEHNLAVVGVTHTRQSRLEEGEDWFNKITGTTGIVGTADQAMLLDVQRGEQEGMLRLTGRDIPDAEYAIRRVGGFWNITDQLRGRRGDKSVEIGDFVIQMGETTTAEVAEHFSMTSAKASQYLGRLRKAGVISQVKRGTWSGTTN